MPFRLPSARQRFPGAPAGMLLRASGPEWERESRARWLAATSRQEEEEIAMN